MAKEKKGSGIQQAAGLIRYFDEESEDAIQISKGTVYLVCIVFSVVVYLANEPSPDNNVWKWMWDTLGF
jgi:preprotein translocase subunit Sec61beta